MTVTLIPKPHKDVTKKENYTAIIEDSDNPHTYEHLIFDTEAKIIQRQKKESSTNGASITGCWHVK